MYLSRATWQALGLSVAGGYAVLGGFAIVFPSIAAKTFFNLGNGVALWPVSVNDSTSAVIPGDPKTKTQTDETVGLLMQLLGARDLSIAAAIIALDWQGCHKEVGTVVLAGMLLTAADVAAVWYRRGVALGTAFLIGATQWGVVGWGLQFWY